MKTILVTGSAGFVGKHVCLALRRTGDFEVIECTSETDPAQLPEMVLRSEFIIHLAGVNRPKDEQEFTTGNADFTAKLCEIAAKDGRKIPIAMTSSIQAERDNPYGISKKAAEDALLGYHQNSEAPVFLYRLPNVFGKWSRPEYNTVVATFCHNISRNKPVTIRDPSAELRFVYIDDVVRDLVELAGGQSHGDGEIHRKVTPEHQITLGALHDKIVSFRDCRSSAMVPDLADPLTKCLYSTYLSFLDDNDFARPIDLKTDDRGWLFELVKSEAFGQIFVSKTKPGITRGNHYHDTKVEKFCVIQGQGIIRFRNVLNDTIIEYPVNDQEIKVVDIPPGLTHSIENTGEGEMLTLFWANEIFDATRPDTLFVPVLR